MSKTTKIIISVVAIVLLAWGWRVVEYENLRPEHMKIGEIEFLEKHADFTGVENILVRGTMVNNSGFYILQTANTGSEVRILDFLGKDIKCLGAIPGYDSLGAKTEVVVYGKLLPDKSVSVCESPKNYIKVLKIIVPFEE